MLLGPTAVVKVLTTVSVAGSTTAIFESATLPTYITPPLDGWTAKESKVLIEDERSILQIGVDKLFLSSWERIRPHPLPPLPDTAFRRLGSSRLGLGMNS